VPQLVGTDFSQGLQQLKDLDLQGQQRATAYQGDVVFAQTPVAGTEVEVESIVSLTPGVAVPDLRGPVSEARRLLVESGLFGYLKYVRSIPMPGGGMGGEVTVDWQSVAPQTIVPRSKRITVSGYQYVPVYAQYYPQEYPIPPKRSINVIFGGGSSQTINNGCARVIPKVGDDDRPGQRLWGGAASPALVGKVGSGGTRGGTDLSDQYAQMGRSGRSTLPPVCGPAGGRGGSGMLWGSGSGGMGGMGGMGSGSMSKGGASGTGMF
jgi:hypothetical protein